MAWQGSIVSPQSGVSSHGVPFLDAVSGVLYRVLGLTEERLVRAVGSSAKYRHNGTTHLGSGTWSANRAVAKHDNGVADGEGAECAVSHVKRR